jgi:hypothetical protein
MTPTPPDDRSDELPPTEAARARRRDHDAGAAARSGMRTGLAKQFKQVLDAQVKRGRAAGAADDAAGADDDGSAAKHRPEDRRRKRSRRQDGPGDPEHL